MKFSLFPISLAIILHYVGLLKAAAGLQCLDESGNPVDWIILYKLPKSLNRHKPWKTSKIVRNAQPILMDKINEINNTTNNFSFNETNDERKFTSKRPKKNFFQLGKVCVTLWAIQIISTLFAIFLIHRCDILYLKN
jgi:hypothetical protein